MFPPKALKRPLKTRRSLRSGYQGADGEEVIGAENRFPPEAVRICLDVIHCVASGYYPWEALNVHQFFLVIEQPSEKTHSVR